MHQMSAWEYVICNISYKYQGLRESRLLKIYFFFFFFVPGDSTILTELRGFVLDSGYVSVTASRQICFVERLKAAEE